jgi:hypothetical protein
MENEITPNVVNETDDRVTVDNVGLSCETCFYRVGEDCRRFPPTLVSYDDHVITDFPDARAACGEWATDTEPPGHFGLAEVAP